MEVVRFSKHFLYLIFLCGQSGNSFAHVRFSNADDFSGLTCPAYFVIFTNEDGLSLSQCSFLCGLRANCYGFFHHKDYGKCIGCRDKFPKSTFYPNHDGMLFYKASLEYILTKYTLEKKLLTRQQAKENCMSLGGQLAAFRSEEERRQLEKNLLHVYSGETMLWQDGYYINNDKKFCWFDGTPAADIKWAPNEPDFNGAPCVVFYKNGGFWASYDTVCDQPLYSVCELDL